LIASDVLKNEKGCAVDACSALSHADMPLQMYFCWNFGKAIIKPVNRSDEMSILLYHPG
jgi:hypothetical protein